MNLLLLLAMTSPKMQTPDYTEPLRPQFHFTAKTGWLNDPNGLVYYKGEYHLFFQHNPFGTQWGNMTWGHAVSKDLVHWRQIENAIEPDALGTIFSGSAVVDSKNTSGFGTSKNAPLICIYTAAGGTNDASKGKPFTQCIAYSVDGRRFTKYPGNPVLDHIEAENRDPKVMWDEARKRWVMALYLNGDRYALFSSSDLKKWVKLSDVPMSGTGECPDLFPLPLDGRKSQMKWIFWGGNGNYRVGSFDGTTFHPDTEVIRSNFGNTGYAAQTYFNDPKGRRVQIAWHNNAEFANCAWNQEMGFPTDLRLVSTPEGPRLSFSAVQEIKSLRVRKIARNASGNFNAESGLMDVFLKIRTTNSGALRISANGREVTYDGATHELRCLDKSVRLSPVRGEVELRMLVDRASINIFAQGGLVSMPMFSLQKSELPGTSLSIPDDWNIQREEVYELRSAWK